MIITVWSIVDHQVLSGSPHLASPVRPSLWTIVLHVGTLVLCARLPLRVSHKPPHHSHMLIPQFAVCVPHWGFGNLEYYLLEMNLALLSLFSLSVINCLKATIDLLARCSSRSLLISGVGCVAVGPVSQLALPLFLSLWLPKAGHCPPWNKTMALRTHKEQTQPTPRGKECNSLHAPCIMHAQLGQQFVLAHTLTKLKFNT